MTAERVGALRYDVILNASSLKKGAMDSRSALKTFRDAMKGATTDVDRYQAGIKNLQKLRADGSITQEQGLTILKELNKDLDKAGFKKVAHNEFEKTQVKLLQEELELQKKINREADLEKKIEAEKNKFQDDAFVKRRNRSAADHREVLARQLQIQRANAKGHKLAMLNMRDRMRSMRSLSPGMAAGVAGNVAGAMGASGQTIGAVRGAAMLGAKAAIPVAGIVAMGLAFKKAVIEADKLQRSIIDLGVLMGNDAQGAEKLVRGFQKLARTTPLATSQLVEGARQLMSFGRASSKVTEDLRILGTIAGGDTERMRLLTKAFGDVVAAGKLQGQELRQMTNQGFNPLMAMVDKTGKSYKELRIEMEKGQITSDMVFDAMASQAESYSGRLEASMNTVHGQMQRLRGLIQELFSEGGMKIGGQTATAFGVEMLGDTVEFGIYAMEYLATASSQAGEQVQHVAEGIRKIFAGESDRSPFEGLAKLRAEMAERHPEILAEIEKKESESILRSKKKHQGDADAYARMIKQQEEVVANLAKEVAAREKLQRSSLGITEEEHVLRQMMNDLADAELLKQGTKVMELEKSIKLQKELMEAQAGLERTKKAIQKELDYIDEVYDHEEKRISEALKAKTDAVNKELKLQQELAEAAKASGGPSGDFTAGGADYRFVQQRRNESEARRISQQATKTREQQLKELIDIAESEKQENQAWRARQPAILAGDSN